MSVQIDAAVLALVEIADAAARVLIAEEETTAHVTLGTMLLERVIATRLAHKLPAPSRLDPVPVSGPVEVVPPGPGATATFAKRWRNGELEPIFLAILGEQSSPMPMPQLVSEARRRTGRYIQQQTARAMLDRMAARELVRRIDGGQRIGGKTIWSFQSARSAP